MPMRDGGWAGPGRRQYLLETLTVWLATCARRLASDSGLHSPAFLAMMLAMRIMLRRMKDSEREHQERYPADILLRLGIRHHKEVGAAGIGGDELGQGAFSLRVQVYGGHKEMDTWSRPRPRFCHPVCRHRAVDAAGQHIEARPEVPTGRPPSPGIFGP